MYTFLWLLLFCRVPDTAAQWPVDKLDQKHVPSGESLLNITRDLVHDSYERVASLYRARQDNMLTAPFETGFLICTATNMYRKMVDKYATSAELKERLYSSELVMWLEEIEHHFFEIEHVLNMLHEIERKYKIFTGFNDKYIETTTGVVTITTPIDVYKYKTKKIKIKFKLEQYLQNKLNKTTTKKPGGPWPIDYGWDIGEFWWK